MDPKKIAAALMAKDPGMSPELAMRIAENLSKPGNEAAFAGYPEAQGKSYTMDTGSADAQASLAYVEHERKAARVKRFEELKQVRASGGKLSPDEARWLADVDIAAQRRDAEMRKFGRTPEQLQKQELFERDQYSQIANGPISTPTPALANPQAVTPIGKTKFDPRGVLPDSKSYMTDDTTPDGAAYRATAALRQQGGGWDNFANGFGSSLQQVRPTVLQPAPTDAPIAFSESGVPIEGPAPFAPNRKLQLSGEYNYIASNERGEALDAKNKKLGYYVGGDPNTRTLDRKPTDVSMQDVDPFADNVLEQMYGEHLQAVDDNDGRFPSGHFLGMSPDIKANIKQGVTELRRRRKGRIY
jgi:hypothetical protein